MNMLSIMKSTIFFTKFKLNFLGTLHLIYLILQVLANDANIGYEEMANQQVLSAPVFFFFSKICSFKLKKSNQFNINFQVLKLNGTQIRNIRHLAHLVDCKYNNQTLTLPFPNQPDLLCSGFRLVNSLQRQILDIRVRRQFPRGFGSGGGYCSLTVHSQGLWNSM